MQRYSVNGRFIYLFHGFNVSDGGKESICKLKPFLQAAGYIVIPVPYQWTWLLGVRLCNKKIASAVAALVRPNSIAIGHSNGCALLHHAAHFGAPFRRMVYINPALDDDAKLAELIERVDVFHSTGDAAVRIADLIPCHTWGKMGAFGYTGDDPRYVNHDIDPDSSFSLREHSDAFNADLEWVGTHIVKVLKEETVQ